MNNNILAKVIQDLNVGIVVVDSSYHVIVWNQFMEKHSNIKREAVTGKELFESFPYLPKDWLDLKLRSVFMLKNFSFTTWKQRPYLFKFYHHRPITGSSEFMYQDCVFLPVLDTETSANYACIVVQDMTDIALYEQKLEELKEINETLQQLSQYDVLTSAFNRRYFETQVEKEFSKSKRHGNDFAVVLLDIDFFKKVNDTYGHPAGDEVLKHVVKIASNMLRTSDVFARYGGEEFIMLLTETKFENAQIVSDRIRQRIEESVAVYKNQEIKVTISLGLSRFRPTLKDYLQLVNEADVALYKSKTEGRNRLSIYKEED
ncbi:MAG: diguanylate cyclase [Nitrospirae bacterium]|nr:diguanylate cyclase [Nitrospirota bacterium]